MSVRVTKKVRRVIDCIAKEPSGIRAISDVTNISYPPLWVIVDRLESNGWITEESGVYSISQAGRDGIREADRQSMAQSRPGPRPSPRRTRQGQTRRERGNQW